MTVSLFESWYRAGRAAYHINSTAVYGCGSPRDSHTYLTSLVNEKAVHYASMSVPGCGRSEPHGSSDSKPF
jgi:hypothetical protein